MHAHSPEMKWWPDILDIVWAQGFRLILYYSILDGRPRPRDSARYPGQIGSADVKVPLRSAAAMSISHLRYENRTCEVQAANVISKRICDFKNASAISKRICDLHFRRCDFHIAGAISKRRCSEVGVFGKWQAVIRVNQQQFEGFICHKLHKYGGGGLFIYFLFFLFFLFLSPKA